jgi:RNA polymerase sigma factor (sigma-70 family)
MTWRARIVEMVVTELIEPRALASWLAGPTRVAWRFVEGRTQELAVRAMDRAWIACVVDERDRRAEALLVARLRGLFEHAVRRRGLRPSDRDDTAQEFFLWLMKDDYAALRRWSPEGGRSFDGWFIARAGNQIDSWRRRQPAVEEPPEIEAGSTPPDVQAIVMKNLRQIQPWLQQHCSPQQRDIFERWFLREESAAEIGAALGIKPATVHVTVSRLRKAIQAAFDL